MFRYMSQSFTNRVGDKINILDSFPDAEVWEILVDEKIVILKHEGTKIQLTFDCPSCVEFNYDVFDREQHGYCHQHRYKWVDDVGLVDSGPLNVVRVGDVLQVHFDGKYYDVEVKAFGRVVCAGRWEFDEISSDDQAMLLDSGDVIFDSGMIHRFTLIRDGSDIGGVVINNVAGYKNRTDNRGNF